MTVFLWHVAPVVAAAPLLHGTGIVPEVAVGSVAWLALRVPWVLVLMVLLAGVVAVVGRFERPPAAVRVDRGAGRSRLAAGLAATGISAATVGILLLTDRGLFSPGGPVGLPVAALATYLVGVGLLHVAAHQATWPGSRVD